MDAIRNVLDGPWFLLAWGTSAAVALVVLIVDLARTNRALGGFMKAVWALTVIYSGIVGLAIYYGSGRAQIRRDSVWRKGFRSVAHCYAGCGLGEIVGVIVSVGLFSAGQWVAGLATFGLAYTFGVALTVGPLMQDGVGFGQALKDAVISESASIVVMEAVALGVGFGLSGDATMRDPLFWSALVVSLSLGLVAAWPVNVALVHFGVKEGMHDPRATRAQG